MNESNPNSVRVIRRAFEILEAFDERSPILSLQKISERIDLPKSTTFRLLATMVETGYVQQRGNQDYCLSTKFMGLAAAAQSTFDIRDTARPFMREIRDCTQETVDLSICNGLSRICLDVMESPQKVKSIIHPGELVSLELAAMGKILLAFSAEDKLDRLILSLEGRKGFDPKKLRRQVREARSAGYAYTSGERVPGASAIAAPLRDQTGFATYALAVTGPSYRFDARSDEIREILLDASNRISAMLGWTGHRKRPSPETGDGPVNENAANLP